jgi:uncharacterized lipoprotein YajG
MLARIRKHEKKVATALLLVAVGLLASCATQKEVAIVHDPDAKAEGEMPWNKQEKWETGGQLSGMTDRTR